MHQIRLHLSAYSLQKISGGMSPDDHGLGCSGLLLMINPREDPGYWKIQSLEAFIYDFLMISL